MSPLLALVVALSATMAPGPRSAQPPQPLVSLRNQTKVGPVCAGPGCDQSLTPAPTGRPARFCSPACRVAAHRAAKAAPGALSVEVDMGSATSRGRPPDQAWMVRLRRGPRSVIVAIGLRRYAADRLAEQIADLLDISGQSRS
ncbi:MAG: hypothetical protein ACREQ5_06925 [Candidatus Dormibacteria bacterium]